MKAIAEDKNELPKKKAEEDNGLFVDNDFGDDFDDDEDEDDANSTKPAVGNKKENPAT